MDVRRKQLLFYDGYSESAACVLLVSAHVISAVRRFRLVLLELMKRTFAFSALTFFLFCFFLVSNPNVAFCLSEPDSDEYAVYSVLLVSKVLNRDNSPLVVKSETSIKEVEIEPGDELSFFHGNLGSVKPAIFEDFKLQNQVPAIVTNKFNLPRKITISTEEEISKFFIYDAFEIYKDPTKDG